MLRIQNGRCFTYTNNIEYLNRDIFIKFCNQFANEMDFKNKISTKKVHRVLISFYVM